MALKVVPSIYQGVVMIEIAGPWYTYERAATPSEIASGEQEVTQYDREMVAKNGGTPEEYRAMFAARMRERGLDVG